MFGRATIRLGIGPHSSIYMFLSSRKIHGNNASKIIYATKNVIITFPTAAALYSTFAVYILHITVYECHVMYTAQQKILP